MSARPLAELPVDTLGRRVYAALERGERDAELLDGAKHRRRAWDAAREALFELLRRLEASS